MHDLDERMRIADEIDPPDLWSTIESKANRSEVISRERDGPGIDASVNGTLSAATGSDWSPP